ncbi:MAG: NUDIX domain-containing protein [bacterium]|nr:NUDIX domain-containing protein [bacterium]
MVTFGVATKAVIYNDEGKYLVLKKADKEDINPNTFDIPGGRMSFGEKPEEALVREVKEETGLTVKPLKVFEVWTFTKGDFQLVGINYLCELIQGEIKLSEEHDRALWMSYAQVMDSKDFPGWLIETVRKANGIVLN